jgi:hypothetical protein
LGGGLALAAKAASEVIMRGMAKSKQIGRSALIALVLSLLLPTMAWAGWGDESWGEMIWGGGVLPVPSLSVWGQIALAVFLLAIPAGRLLKRRAGARP